MTVAEVIVLADQAGLIHVADDEPGIRRVRRGRGFSYHRHDGTPVSPAERERIARIVIPPAWTDVWICESPDGHIQATGRDSAGRKQYRYHPEWERVRDETKFDRLADFGAALARLRGQVASDLRLSGMPRRRVLALAVALLDETLIRVGHERYARDNGSFGLTTLTADHIDVSGSEVTITFTGKGGADHEVTFRDRALARLVGRCQELGGQRLFTYEGPDGSGVIGSSDINTYLQEVTAEPFTAKDFRTWGGSAIVTGRLGPRQPPDTDTGTEALVAEAIDDAAETLGNTRAVCRASYVHPVVVSSFMDGTLGAAWRSSRATPVMAREERTLLKLLR